jgi:hypothetical protein
MDLETQIQGYSRAMRLHTENQMAILQIPRSMALEAVTAPATSSTIHRNGDPPLQSAKKNLQQPIT